MVLYLSFKIRGKAILYPKSQDDVGPPLVAQHSSLDHLDSWSTYKKSRVWKEILRY